MMQRSRDISTQNRIEYLDVLRGLMLVIMTFDHLGGPIKGITFQPLGFVSAAAGFIYLSGFVYGLVYTRKYLETDFRTIRLKSERRAAVIYLYHLLVILLVVLPFLVGFINSDNLTAFSERPAQSLILSALLLYQPSNMDILPMYIIFILAGPYVLRAIIAGKWKTVFIISGLLWLINQVPAFQYTRYDGGSRSIDLGYFNIFCWQVLFFSGVFFGYSKVTGSLKLPVRKWTMAFTILSAVVLLAVRHFPSDSYIYNLFVYFSDRSTLGIVRLANFSLFAYLIYAYTHGRSDTIKSGWLSLLGRHSLQVFAYSVCLIYFFQSYESLNLPVVNWKVILFDILLVGTLTIPALLHQYAGIWFPAFKKAGL